MSAALLQPVKQFLRALEATQRELAAIYERKRAALVQVRPAELLPLARTEATVCRRMQTLIGLRSRILAQAQQEGLPGESLRDLVRAIGGGEGPELEHQVDRTRRAADELRRESWVHWIIAQRAHQHYAAVLDLIANHGDAAPTYAGPRTGPGERTAGGALLDASA